MGLTVILLAAGYATRLYPLTKDQPKALLPVGDRVILDDIVDPLNEIPGIRQQVLVTNSRFAGHFSRWRDERKLNVQVLDDRTDTAQTRLGAIRDLQFAREKAKALDDDLLILGTDNLFTWSMKAVVERAKQHAPEASVALWKAPSKEVAAQCGVVDLADDGRILSFIEKNPDPPSLLVALCMYYMPSSVCGEIQRFIDEGGNTDAPGFFFSWLAQQRSVYGIPMEGDWFDIGTHSSYQAVVEQWPVLRKKRGKLS